MTNPTSPIATPADKQRSSEPEAGMPTQDSTGRDQALMQDDNRRDSSDRRAEDRRRSAKGLFELRARRDRIAADRRQEERRDGPRFRLAFWRRLDV